jgi:Tfp pilus assembly protein PilV
MTLIEVMIAMLISTVGLFGMLALVGTVMRGSGFTRQLTEASTIAQTNLERLIGVPKTQLAAQCGFIDNGGAGTVVSPFNAGAVTQVQYTVNCTRFPCGNLSCVDVKVSWTDNAGRGHTITQERARAP